MKKAKIDMDFDDFLRELERRILKGVQPTDPVLKRFTGSPEKAAALFACDVIESDRAAAKDISTMRFVG